MKLPLHMTTEPAAEQLEGLVRPNWREINVVELTDAEVALMTDEEARWCSDLLVERHLGRQQPAARPAPDTAPPAIETIDIDAGGIAVMDTGARIEIYPGEGAGKECFAGELLNPTEREMRGQGHISCLWDRSKVVRIEPLSAFKLKEQGNG